MKILLTGGTGYLGSRILKSLIELQYEVIVLKRSFSDTSRINEIEPRIKTFDIDLHDVEDLFKCNQIDLILHCATDYGRNSKNSITIIGANLLLPLTLIELGKNYGVKYFVNTDTILDKRINDYSLSKKQFKEWLNVYSDRLCCFNVSLEHFYGPCDDNSKFISFIIEKLLNNADTIPLTPGEQKRGFIFIDDVVSAFIIIIKNCINYQKGFYEFEVGTGELYSIRYVVELIKELAENYSTILNFGAVPYRENEVMNYIINNRPLQDLGWSHKYSLCEGLQKTIKEYRNR